VGVAQPAALTAAHAQRQISPWLMGVTPGLLLPTLLGAAILTTGLIATGALAFTRRPLTSGSSAPSAE
jgi:hypothetical protein